MIKLKNIPNMLTVSRIFICPIWFVLVFYGYHIIAFILVIIFAFTDYLDGFLARKFNSLTAFGKVLDPIADKIFIATILITFASDYRASPALVIIIIVREIIVSGLREIMAAKGKSFVLNVTILSKIKTAFQFISIVILSLIPIFNQYAKIIENFGSIFLLISAILSIYTGYKYVIITLKEKSI